MGTIITTFRTGRSQIAKAWRSGDYPAGSSADAGGSEASTPDNANLAVFDPTTGKRKGPGN
jgi:hypothetical protein